MEVAGSTVEAVSMVAGGDKLPSFASTQVNQARPAAGRLPAVSFVGHRNPVPAGPFLLECAVAETPRL